MTEIVAWINGTPLHQAIIGSSWLWPVMEIVHFTGLCLLLGSLLIVDLRVIGFARDVPLRPVDRFIIATLIGFGLNAATGTLFVFGDPGRYLVNGAFRIKIVLIALAGLNALYFTLRVRPRIKRDGVVAQLGADAKIVAGLSLSIWISVIILGRFIPYV